MTIASPTDCLNKNQLFLLETLVRGFVMQLRSINYKEYEGKDQEWFLDGLTLGLRNLLVGRNATGKTRTLNVIANLAKLICGEIPQTLSSSNYKAIFSDGEKEMIYALHIENQLVLSESFSIDGKVLLERGAGGEGRIFAERVDGGKVIEFQTPEKELAAVVRRDSKQHSYLQFLYDWGTSVRHFQFGANLGKDQYAIVLPKGGIDPSDKDASQIVGILRKALKNHPTEFKEAMLRDMELIDYPLEDIGTGPQISISVLGDLPGSWLGSGRRNAGSGVKRNKTPCLRECFGCLL